MTTKLHVCTSCGAVQHYEPIYRPVQRLLVDAEAFVMLDEIASWTPAQLGDAVTWACQQIDATARSNAGRKVSIQMPDHVAAAHLRRSGVSLPAPPIAPHGGQLKGKSDVPIPPRSTRLVARPDRARVRRRVLLRAKTKSKSRRT